MIFFILGAGYIGQSFLSQSQHKDYYFKVSTTTPSKRMYLQSLAQEVFLLKGNERQSLQEQLEESDGIGIFVAPPKGGSYEETYLGIAEAVAFVLEDRKRPFYLLYTSSSYVYEGCGAELATEDTILKPQSIKAQTLLAAEQIYLGCKNEHVSVCILRLGGIYGPGRELSSRAKILSGRDLAGCGLEPTNHVHREDVVRALQFCLDLRLEGIFNLVNEDHPSRKELYETLCGQLGLALPLWNPQKQSDHGCGCYVSNHKIVNKGFRFLHPSLEIPSIRG